MSQNGSESGGFADVAVIGGGPGGATISSLLADKGWQVALFEKDPFPRFHIGESLLPRNLAIFARLGVLDRVRQIGVPKRGAEFIPDIPDRNTRTFYFSEALKPTSPYAFQVPRDRFDRLLLDNARDKGVMVHQPAKVEDIHLAPTGSHELQVRGEKGERRAWRCTFLVDASGRDSLLGRRLQWKWKNPRNDMGAVYAHFQDGQRREGPAEGNISVYWFEQGWLWLIPLPGGVMSVGAVCRMDYLRSRKGSLAELFQETIERCPEARDRLTGAHRIGKIHATGSYSYRSRKSYGHRFLMVGDAYTFLDPVFSSGVLLAMRGGELGAETVDGALRRPRRGRRYLRRHQRRMDRAIRRLSWFVYRFQTPAMRELFSLPGAGEVARDRSNLFRMKAAVISLLGGDFFYPRGIRLPLLLFKGVYYVTALRHRRAQRS